MNSPKKTNVCRLLDQAKIHYELVTYEVHTDDLSAQAVAMSLGQDINQVFKTIVLTGDKIRFLVCVVPGNTEINLKSIAQLSGNKKCEPLLQKLLLETTGYIRGGCSPIGMKKPFPTFIHETAQNFDHIYVSAGQRGLQLQISPQDLATITKARFVSIATAEENK